MTEPTKEQVWKEEFKSLFNEKYNKTLCGYTLRQWTTQERMDQEREFAFPYYVEARKKAQEDIEFWKNEYVSHSETMCRCQEELQKTRERLEKAESILKVSVDINISGWQSYRMANQYFKDKDKQGE